MAPARTQRVHSHDLPADHVANPDLFIDPMLGSPLAIYIEKDVNDRDSLCTLVTKNGGSISQSYSGVPYIIVDPLKPSGQNLYRQYATKRGKIVLSYQWINECIEAGQLHTFHANWAGCKVTGNETASPIPAEIFSQPQTQPSPSTTVPDSHSQETVDVDPTSHQPQPQPHQPLAQIPPPPPPPQPIHPQVLHPTTVQELVQFQYPTMYGPTPIAVPGVPVSVPVSPSRSHLHTHAHTHPHPPQTWQASSIAPSQTQHQHIAPSQILHRATTYREDAWDGGYDHTHAHTHEHHAHTHPHTHPHTHTHAHEDDLNAAAGAYDYTRYREEEQTWVAQPQYYDPTAYDEAYNQSTAYIEESSDPSPQPAAATITVSASGAGSSGTGTASGAGAGDGAAPSTSTSIHEEQSEPPEKPRGRKRGRAAQTPAPPASSLVANRYPPARSPTPPTRVVKSTYGGNLFTAEDVEYLKKYIVYCREQGLVLSLREICERIAVKAPHHTFYSWRRYCNKKQIRLPGYVMASTEPNRGQSDSDVVASQGHGPGQDDTDVEMGVGVNEVDGRGHGHGRVSRHSQPHPHPNGPHHPHPHPHLHPPVAPHDIDLDPPQPQPQVGVQGPGQGQSQSQAQAQAVQSGLGPGPGPGSRGGPRQGQGTIQPLQPQHQPEDLDSHPRSQSQIPSQTQAQNDNQTQTQTQSQRTNSRIIRNRNRSPTPPRALYRSTTGKGVAFTDQDVTFLKRFMEYRKAQGKLDMVAFWKDVAAKAPHHSRASWMKYWRRHKHELDPSDTDDPPPQAPEKKMRYSREDDVLLAQYFRTKPEGTSDKIFQAFGRLVGVDLSLIFPFCYSLY
ncbi:hypothetical protein D9758_006809 [Tetrapyrgos nigripes]|uniref:BRCT domain-containing protein n=1 Tax=Tetrapyrgos nigripes TaxID=182062 RepID=A0A8H5FT30_9AGAR|nr:hypothetical protein D9758_006809 [Tetrapyrgos nigripes]